MIKDRRKQFLQRVVHMVHEKVHVAEYQAMMAFEQTKEEAKERAKRTKELARDIEGSARHKAYEMLEAVIENLADKKEDSQGILQTIADEHSCSH